MATISNNLFTTVSDALGTTISNSATVFDENNTQLVNLYGGDYIVPFDDIFDHNSGGDYLMLPNIMTISERDSLINNYWLYGNIVPTNNGKSIFRYISLSLLNDLFVDTNIIMVIVENIKAANINTKIKLKPYDSILFKKLKESINSNTPKDHFCFILEKQYFDGEEAIYPNGFAKSSYENYAIILGKETLTKDNDYVLIFNAIKADSITDESPKLVNINIPDGTAGMPPAIGVKVPPKSQK
jgi:hypothetical protein